MSCEKKVSSRHPQVSHARCPNSAHDALPGPGALSPGLDYALTGPARRGCHLRVRRAPRRRRRRRSRPCSTTSVPPITVLSPLQGGPVHDEGKQGVLSEPRTDAKQSCDFERTCARLCSAAAATRRRRIERGETAAAKRERRPGDGKMAERSTKVSKRFLK